MKFEAATTGSGARHLFNLLVDKEYPLEDIERISGISRQDLFNPDIRIPMDGVMQLAEIAFRITGDSALGLHLAEEKRNTPYHFITNLALSCDTLEEAFNQWVRYARLESDASRIELRKEGRDSVLTYIDISPYQAVWLRELYMATIMVNCRKFVCNDFNPLEVRFMHAAPSYIQEYKRIFKAPVYFGADENAIKFSWKDMNLALPTRNPMLKAVMQKQADIAMEQNIGIQSPKDRVMAWIIELLPRGKADLETIAAAMNMERRSLQRSLKMEDSSFSALLEQARRSLSLEYLKQGLSVKEIAHLLDYSESSAFQHAFKRWFGQSPGQYRKQ